MIRLLAFVFASVLAATPAMAAKLKVVATFSIVGDMVQQIAGDKIELTTLVGPDSDAHAFEPSPQHARAVARADIVFLSGLNFEPWAARLKTSTKTRAKFVTLSDGVTPRARDPHAWQDVKNALLYARNIAAALTAADQANAELYRTRLAAYAIELTALDDEIRASLAKIPPERRRVITTHDAFGYFAAAYGITFIAPLGLSTEEQASAKTVARLITQIRRENITAVFVENVSGPRLIEQIARETGVRLGGKLYSDALSKKDGPAPTYVAMIRHNAKLLTAAMAAGL